MENDKKPSEPSEAERWAEMENEIRSLKRSRSIFNVYLLLQSITVLHNVLRINRISDALSVISDTLGTLTDTSRTTLQILEAFKLSLIHI